MSARQSLLLSITSTLFPVMSVISFHRQLPTLLINYFTHSSSLSSISYFFPLSFVLVSYLLFSPSRSSTSTFSFYRCVVVFINNFLSFLFTHNPAPSDIPHFFYFPFFCFIFLSVNLTSHYSRSRISNFFLLYMCDRYHV